MSPSWTSSSSPVSAACSDDSGFTEVVSAVSVIVLPYRVCRGWSDWLSCSGQTVGPTLRSAALLARGSLVAGTVAVRSIGTRAGSGHRRATVIGLAVRFGAAVRAGRAAAVLAERDL